jgi:hypothetical protein
MALIEKEFIPPQEEQFYIRLDPELKAVLDLYCVFIESSTSCAGRQAHENGLRVPAGPGCQTGLRRHDCSAFLRRPAAGACLICQRPRSSDPACGAADHSGEIRTVQLQDPQPAISEDDHEDLRALVVDRCEDLHVPLHKTSLVCTDSWLMRSPIEIAGPDLLHAGRPAIFFQASFPPHHRVE